MMDHVKYIESTVRPPWDTVKRQQFACWRFSRYLRLQTKREYYKHGEKMGSELRISERLTFKGGSRPGRERLSTRSDK